jgi:Ni,Fe-hydrogenase III small subunit
LVVSGVAMIVPFGVATATAKPSPKATFSAHVRAIGTQAQHALLALPPTTDSTDPTEAAATVA